LCVNCVLLFEIRSALAYKKFVDGWTDTNPVTGKF